MSMTCKLQVHDLNFSTDDVIFYKDYPGLEVGDIVEVYHEDGEYSRLLVQVKHLHEEGTGQKKGSISVLSSLASSFYLRQYHNVIVNKVEKHNVTLNILEVIIKDHFTTRGDCWRLHRSLIGACSYISQKIHFLNMRISVNEMWMRGDKVACGVVGETTKIVYRSASAMFHIFVQMSAEMWEFDYTGELFFEKAIMYFLQDLFNTWRDQENSCNHQVVIVLFSRTYYTAKSIDELSPDLQGKVLRSDDGRFYQDFYKVIRQCEKHDNLQNVLLDLKSSFHGYPLYVGCQQPLGEERSGKKANPKGIGINSRASQGNLLEAINLSLNVFEKGYINCNLEETNCTTLIITPSSGVFEVDEELTSLTRNRLIDNGVGIDLVCLAEQPLHAVPLIKFISKSRNSSEDTYNVPQWINLSYYSKPNSKSSVFVPRMRVPEKPHPREISLQVCSPLGGEITDYDEYDAKVFDYTAKIKPSGSLSSATLSSRPSTATPHHSHGHISLDPSSAHSSPEVSRSLERMTKKHSLQEEIPYANFFRSVSEDPGRQDAFDDLKFTMESDKEDTPTRSSELIALAQNDTGSNVGTTSKFNPFKPKEMATKLTLFKHRWLHTFAPNSINSLTTEIRDSTDDLATNISKTTSSTPDGVEEAALAISDQLQHQQLRQAEFEVGADGIEDEFPSNKTFNDDTETTLLSDGKQSDVTFSPNSTLRYDTVSTSSTKQATWTGTLKGVDWKSLCFPACLPLTIHYFPEAKTLTDKYVEYNYNIVIENEDFGQGNSTPTSGKNQHLNENRFNHTELPPEEKFKEMISQRISRGFQFVTHSNAIRTLNLPDESLQSMEFIPTRSYVLSIGLTLHCLRMVGEAVQVTRYSLRDNEQTIPKSISYRFNMWPYNCPQYSRGCTEFKYDSPNNYAWNSVDRYICDTGKDFNEARDILEVMKYWRLRYLLLPVQKTALNPHVKQDIRKHHSDHMIKIEGFIRFLEAVNKIKRNGTSRPLFGIRAHLPRRKCSNEHRTPERNSERKESRISMSDKRTSPIHIDVTESSNSKDTTPSSASRSLSNSSSSAPNSNLPLEMPPEHFLSIHSPLADIIKAMISTDYGLTFIPRQDNLREYTFISAEAVAWMIKSIDECNTKEDAVTLGQKLLEAKLILHASESSRQTFVDGFYLYFIQEDKKEEETEKRRFWFNQKQTEDERLHSYNTKFLEVAVWRTKPTPDKFLADPLSYDITYKDKRAPEGAVYSDKEHRSTNTTHKNKVKHAHVPLYKKMEYNPDINQKSCRSEWCVIAYHGNYYPNLAAYAFEVNWLVSSGSIIADMVHKWSHKATSCGFHMVPAPMCVFPRHSIRCSRNPFRESPFIPLNVDCLMKPGQKNLFDKYDPKTWSKRMLYFQESILYKFEFLRDIPQTGSLVSRYSNCKSFLFIHISGSIFVKINDMLIGNDSDSPTSNVEDVFMSPFGKRRASKRYNVQEDDKYVVNMEYKDVVGFFWVYNYALTKKWQSNNTGTVTNSRNYMRGEFSDFCMNKNNKLVEFWNEVNEENDRKQLRTKQQQHQEQQNDEEIS